MMFFTIRKPSKEHKNWINHHRYKPLEFSRKYKVGSIAIFVSPKFENKPDIATCYINCKSMYHNKIIFYNKISF